MTRAAPQDVESRSHGTECEDDVQSWAARSTNQPLVRGMYRTATHLLRVTHRPQKGQEQQCCWPEPTHRFLSTRLRTCRIDRLRRDPAPWPRERSQAVDMPKETGSAGGLASPEPEGPPERVQATMQLPQLQRAAEAATTHEETSTSRELKESKSLLGTEIQSAARLGKNVKW